MLRLAILILLVLLLGLYFSPGNTVEIKIVNGAPVLTDNNTINWALQWELLLGILIAAFFAYGKFNQWTEVDEHAHASKPPRHFTTWDRFVSAAFFYVLFVEGVFLTIVLLPEWATELDRIFHLGIFAGAGGTGLNLDPASFREYNVLYALIMVVAIMPQAPGIRRLEARVRHALQEQAFIPAEAQATVLRMVESPDTFLPERRAVLDLIEQVPNCYLEFDDYFSQNRTLKHRLAKAIYVQDRLNHWNLSPRFVRLRRTYNEEFRRICDELAECRNELTRLGERKYESLRNAASAASREIAPDEEITLRTSASDWGNLDQEFTLHAQSVPEDTRRYIDRLESDLSQRVDQLIREQYAFVVSAILAVEKLPWARSQRFAELGFRIDPPKTFFVDWDTIVRTLACLGGAMLASTLVFYVLLDLQGLGKQFGLNGPGDAVAWAAIGLAMHGVGMVTAASVMRAATPRQRRHHGGQEHELEGPAALLYLLTFLSSSAAAILVLYLVGVLYLQGGATIWTVVTWGFLPGVTGVFTAIHLKDALHDRVDRRRATLLQGGATGLAGFFIAFILANPLGDATPPGTWPYLAYVFVTTALVGAAIGYVFPDGYRRQLIWRRNWNDRRDGVRVRTTLPVKWRSEAGQLNLQSVDVARGGIAIRDEQPLNVGDFGEVLVPRVGVVSATVVRKTRDRTCLKFLFERPRNAMDSLMVMLERNPNHLAGELPQRAA